MTTSEPRWDLTSYFPSFDSEERRSWEASLEPAIDALTARARALPVVGAGEDAAWEAVVLELEELSKRLSHLSTYVVCLASEDATNEAYTLAEGRMTLIGASMQKLLVELRRGLGGASDEAAAALYARPALSAVGYMLSRLRVEATTSMTPALEGLAADLAPFGINGWGRLYDSVAGRLTFRMTLPDGTVSERPAAQRRSLMADPDRRVRQAAFDGGNVAWKGASEVLGATLNHIAGTRLALNQRRGVKHFLDVALHQAGVNQRTLDAMFEAVKDRIAIPRRGLAIKARAMGLPAISWFDLEAPLPVESAARVPWAEGAGHVAQSFERAYPKLAAHFRMMLERRWIEAAPAPAKRPGAYCIGSDVTDETRVFMTYQGSLGDVSTLAHEVGHAFHAEVLRGSRYLERQYPMTLAETASTFAEAILADGLLSDPKLTAGQRKLLLGKTASDAAAFLLDVPTRFYFEKSFYEERQAGEVPTSRLCELMVAAQRAQFGAALAEGQEDPYFWASKLHFFIPDTTFYNFPYTFGYLLSRGMYAAFREEGAAFLPRYEAFLRESGKAMAHEVARSTVGRDLESPAFWCSAIDTLVPSLDELDALVG